MNHETERDRGILTEADWAYLRGESDLTEGSEYNRRRDIRERLRNSILDFTLLMENFEDNEDLVREVIAADDDEVWQGMADAIALFFCAVTDRIEAGDVIPNSLLSGQGEHHSTRFLRLLGSGLERGYLERDLLLDDAELTTETRRLPWNRIQRELKERERDVASQFSGGSGGERRNRPGGIHGVSQRGNPQRRREMAESLSRGPAVSLRSDPCNINSSYIQTYSSTCTPPYAVRHFSRSAFQDRSTITVSKWSAGK